MASRSKSAGEQQPQQQRASPPDSLPPAPPSPGNPPIPLPPLLNASSTPPKKTWEQHYKLFLTRRLLGNSPRSATPGGNSASDEDSSGRSGKFPGSRRLFRSRSRNSDVLPPISRLPDMPNLMQTKSNEELAVRGGNVFQAVFSRDKAKGEASSEHSFATTDNDGPVSPSQRRMKDMDRSKSTDALDSTLRGGHEKTLSPNVQRISRKRYDDLETPVHGGVPQTARPQGNLPTALSSSARMSREMKKAFTEFHNSAEFSLDASSPYLGDDPSIRPSNYLAMPKRTIAGGTCDIIIVGMQCVM